MKNFLHVYNFQRQFAERVSLGLKRTTIRPNRIVGDPKPGHTIRCYTGQRTKACQHLTDGICTRVAPITIALDETTREPGVAVFGQLIKVKELERLAIEDGFDSPDDFIPFFRAQYGLPFHGLLIEWHPCLKLAEFTAYKEELSGAVLEELS